MRDPLTRLHSKALVCRIVLVLASAVGGTALAQQSVDLPGATVVTRTGQLPKAEQTAALMLVEELEKRIDKRLPISTAWPKEGLAVVVTAGGTDPAWG
ncbi:MAG: hypothetical protein NTU83_05080, partial [Candidatus Hydrogenedentes bacterium]|nr:hypothetical protein [Candidatus Hydrogenedentota bacterium]